MKTKLLISSIVMSVGLISTAWASAVFEKPAECPSVHSIKAVGFKDITHEIGDGTGLWYSSTLSASYDTENKWSFLLGNIQASSQNDAYTKAVKGLDSLQFDAGPQKGPLNKWICRYHTAEGYIGAAISPPVMAYNSIFLAP